MGHEIPAINPLEAFVAITRILAFQQEVWCTPPWVGGVVNFVRNSVFQKNDLKLSAVIFGGSAMKGLVLLGALIALCAGLAQTSQGHVLLSHVGLYEQPASYTGLAFITPGDLPSALPSPNSPVNVSFSIHNASGSAHAYQWSVVLKKASQSRVKASGTAIAPAQGRATITRSVVMACVGGRIQVLVRLASPAESIDFWMTCPASVQSSR